MPTRVNNKMEMIGQNDPCNHIKFNIPSCILDTFPEQIKMSYKNRQSLISYICNKIYITLRMISANFRHNYKIDAFLNRQERGAPDLPIGQFPWISAEMSFKDVVIHSGKIEGFEEMARGKWDGHRQIYYDVGSQFRDLFAESLQKFRVFNRS